MKIDSKVEMIFAQAAALEQNGRFRSTVYCIKNKIFLMNQDHSLIIKNVLNESVFDSTVSFRANDYESREFQEHNGRIVFYNRDDEYVRMKSCAVPGMTPGQVEEIWTNLFKSKGEEVSSVIFHKGVLPLLEDDLSHIEFSVTSGKWKLAQRNIYSGAVIEVQARSKGSMLLKDEAHKDFETVGMRTSDFKSLFSFCDSIRLSVFSTNGLLYIKSTDSKWKMSGFLSGCKYDQLGEVGYVIEEDEEHGREKQKVRRRQ